MLINLIIVFIFITLPFALIFNENATVDESSKSDENCVLRLSTRAAAGKGKKKRKHCVSLKKSLSRKNMRHAIFVALGPHAYIHISIWQAFSLFLLRFSCGQPWGKYIFLEIKRKVNKLITKTETKLTFFC